MADRVQSIKRAQKESQLLREIAQLFHQASMDDPRLSGLMINRVQLSQNKSVVTVYFYTSEGKEKFDELLHLLVLYKPSLRAALAKKINSRYAPDLVFTFDSTFEKEQRLNELLDQIKKEDES